MMNLNRTIIFDGERVVEAPILTGTEPDQATTSKQGQPNARPRLPALALALAPPLKLAMKLLKLALLGLSFVAS